ncbi:TAXI family TRAP transporter solute-binding subunit [Celeribacter sp.]|uniref:TAXI family TRAP transporter solute-binding subunit n=1 Tax=Celeribacter sp. TaxID=1890673 RepID=UPI003A8DB092
MNITKILKGVLTSAVLLAGPGPLLADNDWPSDIKIGTASQGGSYSIIGSGIASLISDQLGINASAEITGGPVQNVTMVETGDHQIALATLGPAKAAWDGQSTLAPGMEHKNLRALFPMYVTPFQVITLRKSGIETVADLEGKRINFGPATGTGGTYWPLILDTLGVSYSERFSGGSDAAGQLTDGLIDAIAFAGGVPVPFFSQLTVEADVLMFGLTEEERQTVMAEMPVFAPFNIVGGTYQGHDYDQETVGMWNFAITNREMPEDMAYEITKTVLTNHEYMTQVHSVMKDMVADNWEANQVIPYHPGAARYLREAGFEIPDELIGQ